MQKSDNNLAPVKKSMSTVAKICIGIGVGVGAVAGLVALPFGLAALGLASIGPVASGVFSGF